MVWGVLNIGVGQASVAYEGIPSAEPSDRYLGETWREQNMYSLSSERVFAL